MFDFDRHKDISAENIKVLQDYNKLEPDNTWDFKLLSELTRWSMKTCVSHPRLEFRIPKSGDYNKSM